MCGEAYLALRRHAGNLKNPPLCFPKKSVFNFVSQTYSSPCSPWCSQRASQSYRWKLKFLEFQLLYSHEKYLKIKLIFFSEHRRRWLPAQDAGGGEDGRGGAGVLPGIFSKYSHLNLFCGEINVLFCSNSSPCFTTPTAAPGPPSSIGSSTDSGTGSKWEQFKKKCNTTTASFPQRDCQIRRKKDTKMARDKFFQRLYVLSKNAAASSCNTAAATACFPPSRKKARNSNTPPGSP